MYLQYTTASTIDISGFLTKTLDSLGNPILVLLLIVLAAAIYYLIKQIKVSELLVAEKDKEIKELHDKVSSIITDNLKIIYAITSSLDKNDVRTRDMENLIRDNNNFLKSISKSLNI